MRETKENAGFYVTESSMEALALQEATDLDHAGREPRDAQEFSARVVPYSSVVGSSVMLSCKGGPTDGKVIGQLALLCFGDKDAQEYWAARLTRALNNGASAEKAIARFIARGMFVSQAPRTNKPQLDVRAFVNSLDHKPGERDNGAAIRRDKESAHG